MRPLILAPGEVGRRLSASALLLDGAMAPLAFTTTEAGTFTIRWNEHRLAGGWRASLHDLATGDVTDLATVESYTFTSDAADWAERFALVLGRGATAEIAVDAARLAPGTYAVRVAGVGRQATQRLAVVR